jgi:hypothetical protein
LEHHIKGVERKKGKKEENVREGKKSPRGGQEFSESVMRIP